MSESFILALDQGTTGTTALLLDRAGTLRGRGYAELPQHFPRPGWVEHDGGEIWTSVLEAVRLALKGPRTRKPALAAIGVTNQRETALLWDRETGEPVAPAIVWQDRRTADRCAGLRRAGREAAIQKKTGLRLDPYFSATKIEWLLGHQKALRPAARQGRLAFGTVDSWLVWNLTGGRAAAGAVHATDPTNASRTLLFDLRKLRWDEGLLDTFGVPAALLPDVRPSSGAFGVTRGVPGLADGVPIAGVAGDQQAALFGQGCVSVGESKNTYGTGCFLLMHTGDAPCPSRHGLLTTVACGPRGEAAWALEGSVFIAGAALQWLRDGLKILARAADSEAMARSVSDSGGVVLVPAFAGLGAPHWNPEARGALFGLTRGTTRAHIARAALESLAFQTADVFGAMERDSGRRLRTLRVDGGAASNDFLMQYQADLLGVPVERPHVLETTALGAGLLAGLGVGFWTSHREMEPARRVERTFRPRQGKAWRASERRRWHEAVARLIG